MRMLYCQQARIVRSLAFLMLVSVASAAIAQPTQPAAPPIGTKHIPDDALAILTFSPSELIAANPFELFPIEVIRAQALDRFGIDPADVSMVKILVGLPGPKGPTAGLVAETIKDVSVEKLVAALAANPETREVDGRAAFVLPEPPGAMLHQVDPRTIVFSLGDWLTPLIISDQGTGQLATLTANMPRPQGITLIAALKPLRPMISGLAQQQSQQLPPPLHPLGRLPELVDALFVNLASSGNGVSLRISMLCADDAGAVETERILLDAIAFGKQLGVAQAKQAATEGEQSEAVKQATLQYIDRIAATLSAQLIPTRAGRKVTFSIHGDAGIASTGVMIGLLLPAVQAAREAARRTSASNNLKQILLAMHNYHDTHNKLPPAAITDANGKPLLSWRVAILPYIEQQSLYNQFHLDEPWDSPHNMPLAAILPAVYMDPSASLEPGYTVFHAVVGDAFGMTHNVDRGFRDFLDGTSNTLLVLEVAREKAVPWSKPDDISINPDDPLAGMGNSHPGGFHVGMADGSVKFVANTINPGIFKALLTRAGGEVIP